MNNNLMTADEARQLLATFQRGRERGDAADVWGPIDRLEDALRTVVAREAEVAALQASMPVRDPVTEEEIDVALVWIRQSDCDTSRRAAHTVEQLANDLAAVRGDRDSLRREVAELRAELDALRTVVAREAEVAALQASMPVRDPVTEEEIDVALVWIRQSDCDTSRRAAHTVEQLANDLAAVRGDRDSLRREVAELRAELDALRGAR